MTDNVSESLRKAIADLINVKIQDAMAHPDGLNRLIAHRLNGVASPQIREAERQLEQAIKATVSGRRGAPKTEQLARSPSAASR